MSAAVTTGRVAGASPRPKARIAGLLYLLTFLTGGVVLLAGRGLVVPEDATATATNILAHESSFRLVFAADLLVVACYIGVTALFYDLFKHVNRSLSLVAALFSLVGCAVQASAAFLDLAPLAILGGAPYLGIFKVEQLQALAFLFLKLHAQAYNIGLVFFGFYCLLIGCLILRSTFLPRSLGVLMALAGLGWLTFLSPPLAKSLSPYILVPGILGEGSLTLWLLAMGVNVQRWNDQASAATQQP
ncbi:MAG TPA: DUF4386 domain-containing protein [Thermoanaerobaculia bacterium]|jgi:hypothetical protein|nr:DUF4386 domain-containing protein [Thermoanaerobaculia bacterium]